MLQLYSKGCEYVLQVFSSLPPLGKGKKFSIRNICMKHHIPEWSTRKQFQRLVHHGFLTAAQGPGGGYQFKTTPRKISVLKLIEALDGKNALKGCAMGFPECVERKPCVLHEFYKPIRNRLISELNLLTIQQIMDRGRFQWIFSDPKTRGAT